MNLSKKYSLRALILALLFWFLSIVGIIDVIVVNTISLMLDNKFGCTKWCNIIY